MDRSVEIRVGVVMLVAIILLVAGLIWITETKVRDRGYAIEAAFATVGGLAAGDPVQVAGVERGRVKDVTLRPRDVLISIWLPSDVKLRPDARVSIENLGMMGEKFVSVTIGDSAGTLAPGSIVAGRYSPGMTETMSQANVIMEDLAAIVSTLRQSVANDSSRAMLIRTIENTDRLATEMTGLMQRSRPQVESAVGDFAASAKGLRSLVDENRTRVGKSLDRIDSATAGIDTLVAELRTTSASLRSITARMDAGEGTLGKLSKDEALYTELRATLTQLDSLLVDFQKHPKKYVNLSIF